ncbi:uncharacterized protein LOC143482772 [Brachyhypopomus gauderio]|uniref:uncharacterized protein LOC143482772 n=1 Tax=Brachyhypopomus gauderio TaxID=698409 RepID=UPI0040422F11
MSSSPTCSEPVVCLLVEGEPVEFLVDTGATTSVLTDRKWKGYLSKMSLSTTGFLGKTTLQPLTVPLKVSVGSGPQVEHTFLFSEQCPINLLGRDLLCQFSAIIECTPSEGKLAVSVTNHDERLRILNQQAADGPAHIYWATLQHPEEQATAKNLLYTFNLWKPWFLSLQSMTPPIDSTHCTFNYIRGEDGVYGQLWNNIEGQLQNIICESMIVGPEGVAALVVLTGEQMTYWRNPDQQDSLPHVSLLVSAGHEPRELGPMLATAMKEQFRPTCLPGVEGTSDGKYWRVACDTSDLAYFCNQPLSATHGRALLDHPQAKEQLETVPANLWTTTKVDVGCASHHMAPIRLKPGETVVHQPQYRIKPEAMAGITDTIADLIKVGVLKPTTSPWNTPILPVKKPGKDEYRMVHDLRCINDVTVTENIPVPDPYRSLQNLTTEHCSFSCIDLANAFFSIPIDENVKDIFAFTFKGQQYTYNRLPQGYKDSPGIFNQCLLKDLSRLTDNDLIDSNTVLIQFVDDLLIASTSPDKCLRDTITILTLLAELGYKVNKSKLQVARPMVTFLGRNISHKGHTLTPNQRQSILSFPKPTTVSQMMSFLGLTGYCRNYIPNYSDLAHSLRKLAVSKGLSNGKVELDWTVEAERDFITLKQALASATELAAPDYTQPFHLNVSVRDNHVHACLFQKGESEGRNI